MKAEILPVLEQQKAGAAEQNFANQLVAQAKQQGLDKAAAAKGLKVVTTDFVPQNGIIPGLADGSPLLTQAFAATKGGAPTAVPTSDGFASSRSSTSSLLTHPSTPTSKPTFLLTTALSRFRNCSTRNSSSSTIAPRSSTI